MLTVKVGLHFATELSLFNHHTETGYIQYAIVTCRVWWISSMGLRILRMWVKLPM